MDIQEFKKLPVLGILRGIAAEDIFSIVEASTSAGLRTIEITMNTDGAEDLIKEMVCIAEGRLMIGAGTVLSMEDMHKALNAGATFIVSPTLVPDVTTYCVNHAIPVFPGAFSPQEVVNAWNGGATMVKVFPAKVVGPTYIKELKGPLNHIELMPCGGVNADTVEDFFKSGASAVGFGESVFRQEWIKARQFDKIAQAIQSIIEKVRLRS